MKRDPDLGRDIPVLIGVLGTLAVVIIVLLRLLGY